MSGLVARALISQVAEAAAAQGDLAGTLFWHWYDRGIGRAWQHFPFSTRPTIHSAT